MAAIDQIIGSTDALDLRINQGRSEEKTIHEKNKEIIDLLQEFGYNDSNLSVIDFIEKIENDLSNQLQFEESVAMLLKCMKETQIKSFSTQPKSVVYNNTNIGSQHSEELSGRDKLQKKIAETENEQKIEDFLVSADVARKILDHQFVQRQKGIHDEREKAICGLSVNKPPTKTDNHFIPSTSSHDFLPFVGLSEVVNQLMDKSDIAFHDNKDPTYTEAFIVCMYCGTDASPMWKKRKLENNGLEILCVSCSDKRFHGQIQKEYEERLLKTKSKYNEQERSLVRDYHEMLSSPRKMELFRQEQEKRKKLQINNSNTLNPMQNLSKATLPKMHTSVTVLQKNPPVKSNTNITDNIGSTSGVAHLPSTTNLTSNVDVALSQSSILKAINAQSNFIAIDQDTKNKLQQIMAVIQSNPILASNQMSLFHVINSVCNSPDTVGANNAKLMHLLNICINIFLKQAQQQHQTNLSSND